MIRNSKIDAVHVERLGMTKLTQNAWRIKSKVMLMMFLMNIREIIGSFFANVSTEI